MNTSNLFNWTSKKLQSVAVDKIKRMVLPYVKKGCSNFAERPKFLDARQWVISHTTPRISQKIANTTHDHVAERLSAYLASGVVFGICSGSYASWAHLSKVREEAFQRSKESYDESVKQYAEGMNRQILKRKEEKEGEIVQESEKKDGLKAVLGVAVHCSEEKAVGNQESDAEKFHLEFAILMSLLHSKMFGADLSTDKHIVQVKRTFPELKFSSLDMADRIHSLEKKFKETRKSQGDNPKMGNHMERQVFDLCMILWGEDSMILPRSTITLSNLVCGYTECLVNICDQMLPNLAVLSFYETYIWLII